MALIYVTLGWVTGIVLAEALDLPLRVWVVISALPVGYFLIWRRDSLLRLWHAALVLLVLGAVRFEMASPCEHQLLAGLLSGFRIEICKGEDVAELNGKGALSLVGVVSEPPDVRDRSALVTIDANRVRAEGEWRAARGRVLVFVPRDSSVQYGDEVQVEGALELARDDPDFSYRDYLARRSIFSVSYSDRLYVVAHDRGNLLLGAVYRARAAAYAAINQLLPEPSASLLAGMLLGLERGIPAEVREAFNATNTSHLIAISGYNIALVAGALAFVLRRFSRRYAFIGIIVGLLLYTLLVGASPSVVRACIMGVLVVMAAQVGRESWALNALAIAALLMTLMDPYVLWDVGFQLSFLATIGLVLIVPPLSNKTEALLARYAGGGRAQLLAGTFKDAAVVTLAAFVFTAPLVAAVFHRVSLIGLLTNLLVLPAQPFIMMFGGAATGLQVAANSLTAAPVLSLALAGLAQVVAWGAFVFLQYTVLVVEATAAVPFASVQVPYLSPAVAAVMYAFIFAVALFPLNQVAGIVFSRAWIVGGVVAAAVVLVWTSGAAAYDGRTRVYFIDTGSGDATLVRTAADDRILINASNEPSALLDFLGSIFPPWDRRLELVVATHLDDANLASLNAVLERYAVGQVLRAPEPARPSASLVKLRELIQKSGIGVNTAVQGLAAEVGEVSLEVVYPMEKVLTTDAGPQTTNAVVRLNAHGHSFLFAPALGVHDRAALVKEGVALQAELAVLPLEFEADLLEAIQPKTVVLFVGRSVRDQPDGAVLQLLEGLESLRTDHYGTLTVVLDGEKLQVQGER